MRLNKKYYPYLTGGAVTAIYLVSRLYNILAIPIFTDEAIYVHWVNIFRNDSSQVFISLTDGKQPLFVWLGAGFIQFVHHNPLLAIRLVSVAAGLFTMTGLYFLSKELFKDKKIALTASLLYIVYPFALLYDKMALYDSLLATLAVWALYVEIILVRRRKFWIAVLCALVVGAGLFTKSSAFFFIYLLPFSLLLFDFREKYASKNFIKWLLLTVFVVAGSMALYSILKLSPNYHYIADKNDVFIYTFHQWIRQPFAHVFHNTRSLLSSLAGYSTIPLLGLMVLSFFTDKKYLKEKLLIFAWFIVPFMALAFFGKEIFLYPRYILFMAVPLLVLAAQAIIFIEQKIKPVYIFVPLLILLVLPMLRLDYYILANFEHAPIPYRDQKQLISGFASGYGVKETQAFLKQKSERQKIYVGTEGIFGLMPQSLQDYFWDNPNIAIKGFWPVDEQPPQEILSAAKVMPTYFIFYAPCQTCRQIGVSPKSWPLKKIFQIKKLDKDTYYTLYQVISK